MDYKNSIAKAKRLINGIEGAICYVTLKGVVKLKPYESDKIKYEVSVKDGVLKVFDKEENKEIQSQKIPKKETENEIPKKEKPKTKTGGKGKSAPKLQNTSDAKPD